MRFSLFLCVVVVAGCERPGESALWAIEPTGLESSRGGPVELRGDGFLPAGPYDFDRPSRSVLTTVVSAAVERGDEWIELVDATWVDAQHIDATVPPGLAAGQWSVHLVTPRGVALVLSDALTIEAADGGPPDGGELDGGAVDGGFDAGPCLTFTFFDGDGDGFGAPDSGALLCGPGRVLIAGDCNDVDPLTSPGGVEVCNARDDDCDGVVDNGVVCTDAGFLRLTDLSGAGNDFLSTWAWGPDSLWIAGGAQLFVHEGDGGFIDESAGCPQGMNSVWADSAGRAFVGGGNNGVGRLTTATRGAGCRASQLVSEPVAGMVGFASADGGVLVEIVLRNGRRVSWDGLSSVQVKGSPVPSNYVLHDAHGSSPDALYAVGGTTGSPQRPAVFRLEVDGGFIAEPLPTQNVPDGQLRGVWVVSATEAVAVGDNGLVLRRVGGAWQRIAPPTRANYTTVRAFSVGRFSLSSDVGSLRQWDGQWTLRYTDPLPVRDLTAFDEAHFWLVGDRGFISHGPLP